MKKYVVISSFDIHSINRGNAALAYGSITFLLSKGLLHDGQEILRYEVYTNPFSNKKRRYDEEVIINGKKWVYHVYPIHILEYNLIIKGITLPFTYYGRTVRNIEFEAADYGGDGFSDIYSIPSFYARFNQTVLLRPHNIPLIMLPQTIGPFRDEAIKKYATDILHYAKEIYVRDNNYIEELDKMGLTYERTADLSSFMLPEKWDIAIEQEAVGLNVSGLAYSNKYHGLEGEFEEYPELINSIIDMFVKLGKHVYLIPHSYRYGNPDPNNDDIVACKEAFLRYNNSTMVHFVDKDMTSPQVKYVISQMQFFIGTRMHANFAAIYTHTPVFGLAYSYKFAGGFNANGLDGKKQTYTINFLKKEDIQKVLDKISKYYNSIK